MSSALLTLQPTNGSDARLPFQPCSDEGGPVVVAHKADTGPGLDVRDAIQDCGQHLSITADRVCKKRIEALATNYMEQKHVKNTCKNTCKNARKNT